MERRFNIACLQTQPRADLRSALDEALTLAEVAVRNGARVLTLPEYCGGLKTEGATFLPPSASEEEHLVLHGFQKFARHNNVWIVIGSIAVTASNGRIFNRGFIIDQNGLIRSRYDKIHMFDIQLSKTEVYKESTIVSGGHQAVLTDTAFGRWGQTICYDLRFPHLYRELAQSGAELLLVPAAFTKKTGEAHWHVLNRARAIENGAYVVSACAIGTIEGGGESFGHSLIIDPWGRILADGGTVPGVIQAEIDLDQVVEVRKKIPSLKHDKSYELGNSLKYNVA